ncbi:hypothetical protein LR48_Vigan01g086600 [Vigna angularis]|uniref:Uncharacterized protein n=1 Tax=Phaseolus angularis TaxID=3914 RepID=A0A0L9TLG5_PHAAN|nr:hypothetical protein LR48_Vigan01g086600 [Vigna angularis]
MEAKETNSWCSSDSSAWWRVEGCEMMTEDNPASNATREQWRCGDFDCERQR